MKPLNLSLRQQLLMLLSLCCLALPALAESDRYQQAVERFREAGAGEFIDTAYGYAVFPLVGKGGIGLGGAYGEGQVYHQGNYVGDSQMAQLTLGWQLGGQAYSQIIFFEDKAAFDHFTTGSFEFGAQASAVALTAGASAEASTRGVAAGASGTENRATAVAEYYKGMAVFTLAKGGLMYEVALGGQLFNYQAR